STAMDGVLAVATDSYWDLVAFRDRQRVAERALALNETIYGSTQQRIEIGVQPASELIIAASQVAASRRDLIIAQTNVQLQEVRLKSMMTKVMTPEIAAIPLEPTDTLEGQMEQPLPTLEDELRTAFRKPGVHQAKFSLESHQIAETFTHNNLHPEFNVF